MKETSSLPSILSEVSMHLKEKNISFVKPGTLWLHMNPKGFLPGLEITHLTSPV